MKGLFYLPKYRARSGNQESTVKRIKDCLERGLNGKPLDSISKEMKAILAYKKWLGSRVKKGKTSEGAGLQKLAFLDLTADSKKAVLFTNNYQSCHGKSGEGLPDAEQSGYLYLPANRK